MDQSESKRRSLALIRIGAHRRVAVSIDDVGGHGKVVKNRVYMTQPLWYEGDGRQVQKRSKKKRTKKKRKTKKRDGEERTGCESTGKYLPSTCAMSSKLFNLQIEPVLLTLGLVGGTETLGDLSFPEDSSHARRRG